MKWLLMVMLAGLWGCAKPVVAPGGISGQVKFTGKVADAVVVDMEQDPQCAKLHTEGRKKEELVVVNADGTLVNAFVYIKGSVAGARYEAPTEAAVIDQKGCWFAPRVVGMQTGQSLQVTNSDPVTHNIHPQAQVNREWNQSQAPEDGPLLRKFAKAEVMIGVKCNVHKWMRAWVGVVDHPFFAVTGAGGAFDWKNVPAGTYQVVAWHEKLGMRETTVVVPAGGKVNLEFRFSGE